METIVIDQSFIDMRPDVASRLRSAFKEGEEMTKEKAEELLIDFLNLRFYGRGVEIRDDVWKLLSVSH
tara:strand:+ start:176 stop:379 length:204 start_codon:yes stop_codon:yes gene_type:complete